MSLQDWAASSPARTGIVSGVPFGVALGAIIGAEQLPSTVSNAVGAGVVGGVVSGVLFGLLMALVLKRQGPRWPRDASSAIRQSAARAVRRGETVSDPALAPAVVAMAEQVQRQATSRLARSARIIFPLVSVIGAVLLYQAVVKGSIGAMAAWSADVVYWPVLLVLTQRFQRKRTRNAKKAEASARILLI